MKIEIYAVRDSAIGAFNRPLFFRSRGEAVRSFQDAVSDVKNGFLAHAAHYDFWFLGTFDDANGSFDVSGERVCGAVDFVVPADSPAPVTMGAH